MVSLRVHDWDEHQTYRSDRGRPPWIKLHRNIFQSVKWAALSDSEKGQLVSMWILAADKDGVIPGDANVLQKLCMLDDAPNLRKFMTLGLLTPTGSQDDAKATSTGSHIDRPEAEEVKRRKEHTSNLKRFDEFWDCYPKKVEKKKAKQLWKSRKLDDLADYIIPDVVNRTKNDGKWLDGYVPNPTTYIRGDRWEDEITPPKASASRVPPESDPDALKALAEQHGVDWKRSNSYFDLRRAISQATGMPL